MIRVILLFLMLAGLTWLAILAVQKMSGKQALDLTKAAVYATISSAVAIMLMFVLVMIF
jgi:hypothetical protein